MVLKAIQNVWFQQNFRVIGSSTCTWWPQIKPLFSHTNWIPLNAASVRTIKIEKNANVRHLNNKQISTQLILYVFHFIHQVLKNTFKRHLISHCFRFFGMCIEKNKNLFGRVCKNEISQAFKGEPIPRRTIYPVLKDCHEGRKSDK